MRDLGNCAPGDTSLVHIVPTIGTIFVGVLYATVCHYSTGEKLGSVKLQSSNTVSWKHSLMDQEMVATAIHNSVAKDKLQHGTSLTSECLHLQQTPLLELTWIIQQYPLATSHGRPQQPVPSWPRPVKQAFTSCLKQITRPLHSLLIRDTQLEYSPHSCVDEVADRAEMMYVLAHG